MKKVINACKHGYISEFEAVRIIANMNVYLKKGGGVRT